MSTSELKFKLKNISNSNVSDYSQIVSISSSRNKIPKKKKVGRKFKHLKINMNSKISDNENISNMKFSVPSQKKVMSSRVNPSLKQSQTNTQNGTNGITSEMLGPVSCTIHSSQINKIKKNPSLWSATQFANYSYAATYLTPKSLTKRGSEKFNLSINMNCQTPKHNKPLGCLLYTSPSPRDS